MTKAKYRYTIKGPVIAIEDLNGIWPVTLEAEFVLKEIEQEIGTLAGKFAIYCDSEGLWDGLCYVGNELRIYPIGNSDFEGAETKIASFSVSEREDYVLPAIIPTPSRSE